MSEPQQQKLKDEMAEGEALLAKPKRERTDEERRLVARYSQNITSIRTYGDLVNVVRVHLRGKQASPYTERWARIIADYRAKGVPASHSEMLDRILGPE